MDDFCSYIYVPGVGSADENYDDNKDEKETSSIAESAQDVVHEKHK